jgi:hypothetical protein
MFPIPLPILDPTTDSWLWGGRPSPAQMRYYGQLGFALIVGLAVSAPLGWWWRDQPSTTTPTDRLYAGWAGVACALCLAYYAWHNWP